MATNIIYDATKNFSSINSDGIWQTGYETTLNNVLVPFNSYISSVSAGGSNFAVFRNGGKIDPNLHKNIGTVTAYGSKVGQIALHPGPSNEYAVLRFTSPFTANYILNIKTFEGNVGDTDATVLLNGQNITYVASTNGSPIVLNSIEKILNKGDRLDLLIGSKGSYISDTTPLEFIVTLKNSTPIGEVTAVGTNQQNQTLTAISTLSDINGLGTLTYQWFRENVAISNATTQHYVLTQDDVGKSISVTARYTDGLGNLESVSSLSVGVKNVNDLPIGSVSISGTPTQGQVLTALNNLTDLDGLGSINYQWLSNGNVISGAVQSNYTLTSSDVGKSISVKASYVDQQGTSESVMSSSLTIPEPINYPPTGSVTILGYPQANQTLTANNNLTDANGIASSITYQWLSNGSVILNSNSYTLTQADEGKNINVTASYTDGLGKLESVTSKEVTVAYSQTPPTGSVTILGYPQANQTLTANNNLTDVNGIVSSITYQWLSNGSVILNSNSYTLTQADEGKNISVTASYTDGLGKLESVTSSAVSVPNLNYLPIGNVSIQGEVKAGKIISASNNLTDLDGLGSINYQWLSNGNVISGAVQQNYTLTASDVGKSISVKASYVDQQGTSESVMSPSFIVTQPDNSLPFGSVTIIGKPIQNETLTASNNLTDANGFASPITYQWLSNGSIVSNSNSYTLTQADVGKNISLKASYTDNLKINESMTSPSVMVSNINDSPTGSVTISGTLTQGQVLTASNTLIDLDGLGTINYQWLSNGNVISGAVQQNYTLTASDVGKSISVKASYVDQQGTAESMMSNSTLSVTPQNFAPVGTVTISGNPIQNQTLLATNNLTDSNQIVTAISYQWLSNGAIISGKTDSKYTLTQDDVGKNISVKASYTDGLSKPESVTSVALTVTNVNDLPTGKILIEGESKVGKSLKVKLENVQDLDGLGTFNYQWLRDGKAIDGKTAKEYVLEKNDVGKNISVQLSFTDKFGMLEKLDSVPNLIAGEIVTLNQNKPFFVGVDNDSDNVIGSPIGDDIKGNIGNDVLKGNSGDDLIDGGNDNDVIFGGDDDDSLLGGNGDDSITGDDGNDSLVGDSGNDTLNGAFGTDTMTGGDGDDIYYVDNIGDVINENTNAQGGNDTAFISIALKWNNNFSIFPGVDNFTLTGNLQDEFDAAGDDNANVLTGNIGNNHLYGNGGDDTLIGNSGDDFLEGGKGRDLLKGGAGNDTYVLDNEDDVIEDSEGMNTIQSSESITLLNYPTVSLLELIGKKSIKGTGNAQDNIIDGNDADNTLIGKSGNDTLNGNAGDDILIGDVGDDSLDGGDGEDIAQYYEPSENYQVKNINDNYSIINKLTGETDQLHDIEIVLFSNGQQIIDVPKTVKLSISDFSIKEGDKDNLTTAKLTLTLDQTSTEEVSVEVSTEDGIAVDGQDYEGLNNQTITIPAGQTTKTISIPIISDKIFEEDENFTVILDNVNGAELSGTQSTVTITNDDKPTLSIDKAVTITEGEKGKANADVIVSLSAPVSETVTVNYKTTDGIAKSSGTAADFTKTQGTLTFQPGQMNQKISIPIIDDKLTEKDESFNVSLSNAKGALLDTQNAKSTVTIKDNDSSTSVPITSTTDKPTISISGPKSVFEDSEAEFIVSLSKASTKTVSVKYKTVDGTAISDDSDFDGTSGTLTFKAGQTKKSVFVSIIQDDTVEQTENFSLQLSSPKEATLNVSLVKTNIDDIGSGSSSNSSALLIDLIGVPNNLDMV